MIRNASLVVVMLLAGSATMLDAAAQSNCPRGQLDKLYCDRNGDMVADLPTDPKTSSILQP